MTITDNKTQIEKEFEEEKTKGKDAENSIILTLYLGLFLGIVTVIGYPISLPEIGNRILFIGLLLAISSFISSFFMGTLFGMPKRNNEKESDYSLNNSLVEISDWLTKIIVGLGLVNLKEIPGYLMSLGEYVSIAAKYDTPFLNIYTIGIVVYFGFLGLYIGYNYMRLVLSNKYKNADDNLIRKELEKEKEKVLKVKEENIQKDQKIIQIQSDVQEKEQLTKTLLKKVNESSQSQNNVETVIKTITGSDAKEDKKAITLFVDKMKSEAKIKLQRGLIMNNNDPQKGQWKNNAINNERELTATVAEEAKGLYKINLKVVSTNPIKNPLQTDDLILFALHNTFGDPPIRLANVENQCAETEFYSYGSFTVGAFVDYGTTELELDLAELPDVSSYFKIH
ncbi:pYEATS domain-containing protein [Flavobacterium sp. N3904]|uniref:pYEATS domain-containing protein n=1 Tax=Flavobacterium sp. N3904 TaxID=2986835 RepID=UPI002224B4B2|nr:pYEATS domain-containing protein [Flavobacterium sp. N3904]